MTALSHRSSSSPPRCPRPARIPRGRPWSPTRSAQIALGAGSGVAVGVLGALALRLAVAHRWMLDGTRWIGPPAIAFLAWFVAHEFGGNVFVAAFAAGLATTAAYGRVPEAFLEFAEVGGELVGLVVFFLFGTLLVEISGRDRPYRPSIYAVLSLTVIRMFPVAIALRREGSAPAHCCVHRLVRPAWPCIARAHAGRAGRWSRDTAIRSNGRGGGGA